MDGVGTFSMAMVLQEFNMLTTIRKHYTFDNWKEAVDKGLRLNNVVVSTGTNAMWEDDAEDYATAKAVLTEWPEVKFICIDVANGYQQNFADFVKRVRNDFPDRILIAGNVITAEMTEQLCISGADIVKCGIGPGCFPPGQQVVTSDGLKNIEDIKIGEKVLTHTGEYQFVTNTFEFDDKKILVQINNIRATPNHEFYVLHKDHKDIVTDDNIDQYAEWISAEELTKDFLLIKHK
tara:strand:- start:244 stop:948 length:705 start_codon:yes stop_codon:yes gene_type:complete